MSYSRATRAKALEAGLWPRRDGTVVRLRDMHDAHLVNALLRSLAKGEPAAITRPLSAEVVRRNLREMALAVAEERSKA